ncbi:MAG: hypothetical protein M3Q14_01825 [bacterium]|nr:hypothetical protein [bacterium]
MMEFPSSEYLDNRTVDLVRTLEEQSEIQKQNWKKSGRVFGKGLLVLSSVTAGFAAQNPELIQAGYEYLNYAQPEDGDIIPERTGCGDLSIGGFGGPRGVSGNYNSENDPVFQQVKDKLSVAHTMTEKMAASKNTNQAGESLIDIYGFYYDTKVDFITTSFGMKLDIKRNHADTPFAIHREELEAVVNDIFNLDMYANPQVKKIVECRSRKVIDEREYGDKVVTSGINPQGDECHSGLSVETFTSFKNRACHSRGLGVNKVGLKLPLGMQPIPENILLVVGANDSTQPNEETINRKFVHELIHVLLFPDLSDTIAELDEQERLVKYMEKSLYEYYEHTGTLPKVITLL